MTIRGSTVAVALLFVVTACVPPTTTTVPAPTAASRAPSGSIAPSPAPSTSPAPPAPPAPTAATTLAVATADRPFGPWAVTFQATGITAVREVYVLSPACAGSTCDISALIQTFDGARLGTALFRYDAGMYRYEADSKVSIACNDGVAEVPDGAIATSHTTLLIAGYRPAGIAAVTVDIRGSRTVRIEPGAASSCGAQTIQYAANGERTEFAAAPTPTPKPPSNPKIPAIQASFFGAGTTLVTYRVAGATIDQIVTSIRANGPWSDWIHARAEALTKALPHDHFDLVQSSGSCHVAVSHPPAVSFTFTITLPTWSRSKAADAATVRWWAGELQRVATHERHHVEIYRDGAARMNDAIAHSTCAALPGKLAAIVKDVDTQQCQFDLDEYGAALGLSLASCLNG